MTKTAQKEAFDDRLSSLLTRIMDFLKFAEAKNAALLTFASAWIIASLSALTSSRKISTSFFVGFELALPLFVVAALVALWSFLPKRKLPAFHRDPVAPKNLLFFGDIAGFDPAAFRDRVRERYLVDAEATDHYFDDLAVQIAVISKIVDLKFKLFNAGACLVLGAMLIIAVPAVHGTYVALTDMW
jgi:hypothetical protein